MYYSLVLVRSLGGTVMPTPPSIDVEVHVRPEQLLDPVDSKLRTLESLRESGAVTSLTIDACPAEIPVSDTGPVGQILDTYERFREWADRVGVSLTPGFDIHETGTIASETRTRVLRAPVLSLGIHINDSLSAVFPHTDGERHFTAGEGIALLRTGELLGDRRVQQWIESAPPPSSASWNCPMCDGTIGNVQGIDVCTGCGWTEGEPRRRRPVVQPQRRRNFA